MDAQDQDLHTRKARLEPPGGGDAVETGHPDVRDDEVGPQALRGRQERVAVPFGQGAMSGPSVDRGRVVFSMQTGDRESVFLTEKVEDKRADRNLPAELGSGYLTDAEVAKLDSDATGHALTQQQVDLKRQELETAGRQKMWSLR